MAPECGTEISRHLAVLLAFALLIERICKPHPELFEASIVTVADNLLKIDL